MGKDKDVFIGIAGAIGGITLVMVMFGLLFTDYPANQASVVSSIVWPMAALGIALGYFASRSPKIEEPVSKPKRSRSRRTRRR